MEDWSRFLALGVDAALAGLVYFLYKQRIKDAKYVQQAPVYHAQSDDLYNALKENPDKTLRYACIEGNTASVGPPLKSQFTDSQGVIQRVQFIEHRMRRVQGFWGEEKKILKDSINSTLFQLVNPADSSQSSSNPPVDVLDALSADFLHETLTPVYDVYDPSKDGFLSRSVDRLFGELTKGFQHKEMMLGLGAPVLGIGRLTLSSTGDRIQLGHPEDGKRYVLTTSTRSDIIRALQKEARSLKILLFVFGSVGVALAGYLLYKYINKWKRIIEFKKRLAEVQRSRISISGTPAGAGENSCVICLTNRRDVIVLDCGHVCLCSSCSQLLTEPALCPVCRRSVSRFMPVYIS